MATLHSSVVVFLLRSTLANGLQNFVRARCQVLWPHEIFAALWEFHPGAFIHYILGGNVGAVSEFWNNMPPRPGMRRVLPIGSPTSYPWQFTAMALQLQNVRGANSKVVDVLSWMSLLGKGSTKFTSFLIWLCHSNLAKKSGVMTTWRSLWAKLTKSLRALFSGRWPDTDMDGRDEPKKGTMLAGGYRAVLFVLKGDLEWMSGHFGLANPSSSRPCCMCRCTNYGTEGEMYPWTDVNWHPSWEESCISDGREMGPKGKNTEQKLRKSADPTSFTIGTEKRPKEAARNNFRPPRHMGKFQKLSLLCSLRPS